MTPEPEPNRTPASLRQPSIRISPSAIFTTYLLIQLPTLCRFTSFFCPATLIPNLSTHICRAFAGSSSLSIPTFVKIASHSWSHAQLPDACDVLGHPLTEKSPFPMLISSGSLTVSPLHLLMVISSFAPSSSRVSMPLCVSENWFSLTSEPFEIIGRSPSVTQSTFQCFHLNTPISCPPTRETALLRVTPSSYSKSLDPLTLTPLSSPTSHHAMPFFPYTLNSGSPLTVLSRHVIGSSRACESFFQARIMPVIHSDRAVRPPLQRLGSTLLLFKLLAVGCHRLSGFTSVKIRLFCTLP